MAEQGTESEPQPPPALAAWQKALTAPVVVIGDLFLFFAQSVGAIFRKPWRVGLFFTQLDFMAYGSLFVVGLSCRPSPVSRARAPA